MKPATSNLARSWGLPRPIIIPSEKSGCNPELAKLPEIRGFPIIFLQRLHGASDFKFGAQLGFAKAHHKITRRRKGGRGPGLRELPKFCGSTSIFTGWLKLEISNLVHSLDLPRPTIKLHPEEKWAWPWVGDAPIYLGFLFNISAMAALSS